MAARLTRVFTILVASLLLVPVAHADWIGLGSDDPATPVLQADDAGPGRTVVTLMLPGFHSYPTEIAGQAYADIVVPGHVQRLERGWPQLPFVTAKLVVPDEGTPRVKIVDQVWRELPTAPVAPSKGNIVRTVDPATVPHAFAAIYGAGGTYPAEATELSEPYILRDHRGVNLRINVLRWDATRGVLLALERATFEVETSGSGGVNVRRATDRPLDRQFDGIYRHAFLNPAGAEKYAMVPADGPLLVVCHDPFMGIIEPFVTWKRERGLAVEVIATSSVGGTTSGIQAAIDERYSSPAGLTYVVLIGDYQQVPTYAGEYEGADDDTRYGRVDGSDLYPDLFVSRVSGQNPVQIQTQIAKFIRYERDPDAGGDWYHQAAGIASNEGNPTDITRAEWLRDDLLGYGFSWVDQIYQGQGGTTAAISNAVNAGRSLINYIGHGVGSGWTSVAFYNDDVHALHNGWAHPWIVDVSCSNGDFSVGECFAEAWMWAGSPAEPHGALAMYASSTTTPWVPPCVMQAETIDLLVADQASVIGSLYYHGIMAVVDEYGPASDISRQLVEQYNIFGDCSLMVRTDTPYEMTVVHLDEVPLGSPSFTVDTGVRDATCALYGDGVLHGVGVTDLQGHVDIEIVEPIASVADLSLTVFGRDLLTYRATIQAVVPADIIVEPADIPVGVTTEVTVTVTDPETGYGMEGVTVAIAGYGVIGAQGDTDSDGRVALSVTPLYGETLGVSGREGGVAYDLFVTALPVTGGLPLTSPAVDAEVPSIGLVGALTPFIEGTVSAGIDEQGFTLRITGAGLDVSEVVSGRLVSVNVTPSALEDVTAAILKPGYDVFAAVVPVVEAFGQYSGIVVDLDDGYALVADARVRGFAAGQGPEGFPLFELTTAADGTFALANDLAVGYYEIYVEKFGYALHHETYFLSYGPNSHAVYLTHALNGMLYGLVTSAADGTPVQATVQVFRTDNGELFAETTTDPVSGAYAAGGLPYFDYRVEVRAFQFTPQTTEVVVGNPAVLADFVLEPTDGELLVIDDNNRGNIYHTAKYGKGGVLEAPSYAWQAARSAEVMQNDLLALGYGVTAEMVDETVPDTWWAYDVIVVACGDNTSTLSNGLKTALLDFVAGGGHLLIEGGEVGYDHQNDAEFAQNVLHIDDWTYDNAGDVTVTAPDHHVMTVPNLIPGTIDLAYIGYGDADACDVASDAVKVGAWTGYPDDGSIVCYDPNPAPEGGQIVFFSFNYEALAEATRAHLLHNAINWLVTPEFGDAGIAGTVLLNGEADHAGATVTVTPGDLQAFTQADGGYAIAGLFAGNYHVVVTKDGWSSGVADIVLNAGETVTDLDFLLNPIVTNVWCDAPATPIPDNDPDGVVSTMTIPTDAMVSQIGVYVDISHTYVGDLAIELTSPTGTTVRLKNVGQGGPDDVWVGWYPDDLTPYENLAAFIGQEMQGLWSLRVIDVGLYDTGTVNEWCLRFTYEQSVTPVGEDELPRVLSLDGNYPNPFNPATTIKFGLPRDERVDLAVFDLRGRKVRTLVAQELVAGRHTVPWNGRDDLGQIVPSGTYVYRLVAGGERLTDKMLLLK